ncbi:MAG: T9SS type A sorting domain-containing protein [Vicingaceae bacterium]|nr:T9SS type A sorting domain-containing protein [Vicingaceae bacterium]
MKKIAFIFLFAMIANVVFSQTTQQHIIPDNSIEQNYLTFFESYIKHQTDTINASDSLTLRTLAMGCPFTDGEVVYQARSLYNAIYKSNVLFEDGCISATARNSFGFYKEAKPIISNDKSGLSYNLVPNYSFENYTACPSGSGQFSLALPWSVLFNPANYLNSCATTTMYSVPTQSLGTTIFNYQEAHSGQGYGDVIVYNGVGSNYRSYAENQLVTTLQNGQCYYVEFFVNRPHGNYGGKYAINNMGCLFTDTAMNTSNGDALNVQANVLKFGNPIITDTANWTPISGIYTANGTENYILLGNFANDMNTDTLDMLDATYPGAVYLLDDVYVLPIDSMPDGMPAYAGVDTNVTIGDSVFIGQQISNLNCNWYDEIGTLIASNISGIYVSPTNTTYYVVEQNLCGVITYDTVNVEVMPTGINELFNENKVRIYPNPTTGELSIEMLHQNSEWSITIFDLQGRTVVQQLVNNNKVTLKLELENGVYLARITNKNTNETVIKKLIINR